MKEMNLEKQLRSWQPRRPSAGIKLRLFPDQRRRRKFIWAIGWFAPTVACGLVALAVLRQDGFFSEMNSHPRISRQSDERDDSSIAGVTINRSPDFFEW